MTDDTARSSVWGRFELALDGPSEGNPFLDVDLGATFRLGDRAVKVTGFYDGDGVYRLRFMPDAEGAWTFATRSNVAALDGVEGTFAVGPAKAGNHGPVVADGMHFRYADGTRYLNVGTTAYAWNHQDAALQEQTLAALAEAPFTKIRMCVFPKHYRYNQTEPDLYPFRLVEKGRSVWPATQAETGWKFDFDRIEPAFFRRLEDRIARLGAIGVEADLILLHPYDRWGFDHMSPTQDDRYLRYVVARLAAFPNVWWSMANEYDLMPNKSLADWDRYIRIVAETDPHGHLLSVHNCFEFYDYRHPAITHCSIQHEATGMAAAWRDTYRKPVSIDECCYEGDIAEAWGNISGREMTHRFWTGVVNGAYVTHGETYDNATETVWWAKGGALIGESVPRIAFLRQILEEGPEEGLDPVEYTFPYRMALAGDRTRVTMPRLTAPPAGEAAWEPRIVPMFALAGQPHRYYMVYFGTRQPHEFMVPVPPGESYSATLVDTWDMTRTEIAAEVRRGDVLDVPPKSYQAIIFRRVQVPAGAGAVAGDRQ